MRPAFKFEVYRAKDGWRWHLRAANGRVVADSGEAYVKRATCVKMCHRLRNYVDSASVDVLS